MSVSCNCNVCMELRGAWDSRVVPSLYSFNEISELYKNYNSDGNAYLGNLVRNVHDARGSVLKNDGFNRLDGLVTLEFYLNHGVKYPFGWFGIYSDSSKFGSMEDIYNHAVGVLYKDNNKTGVSPIQFMIYSIKKHLKMWTAKGLPAKYCVSDSEILLAINLWFYNWLVMGVLGEVETLEVLNKFFNNSKSFNIKRAEDSLEKEDVDLIINRDDQEIKVSVKCGNTVESVLSSINYKREKEGKLTPDLYCGFFTMKGKKYFYYSEDGTEITVLNKSKDNYSRIGYNRSAGLRFGFNPVEKFINVLKNL